MSFIVKSFDLNEKRPGANPSYVFVNAPFSSRKLFVGVNIDTRISKDLSYVSLQNGSEFLLFDFKREQIYYSSKEVFLDALKKQYPTTVTNLYYLNSFIELEFPNNEIKPIDFSLMYDEFENGLGEVENGVFKNSFFRREGVEGELFESEKYEELRTKLDWDTIFISEDGKYLRNVYMGINKV